MKKFTAALLMLMMVLIVPLGAAEVYAASGTANLTVSKDGTKFKLKNGKKSYSFRYDWDAQKQSYTGYSMKKAKKVVPAGQFTIGLGRDGVANNNDSILLDTVKLNGKIYKGMSLKAFHKAIKKAWGSGSYGYWDSAKNGSVDLGAKKPSDSVVKARAKSTGLYWTGKRGKLKMTVMIQWDAKAKQAVTGWTEIFGEAAD